jgi:hypothetical protein
LAPIAKVAAAGASATWGRLELPPLAAGPPPLPERGSAIGRLELPPLLATATHDAATATRAKELSIKADQSAAAAEPDSKLTDKIGEESNHGRTSGRVAELRRDSVAERTGGATAAPKDHTPMVKYADGKTDCALRKDFDQ